MVLIIQLQRSVTDKDLQGRELEDLALEELEELAKKYKIAYGVEI